MSRAIELIRLKGEHDSDRLMVGLNSNPNDSVITWFCLGIPGCRGGQQGRGSASVACGGISSVLGLLAMLASLPHFTSLIQVPLVSLLIIWNLTVFIEPCTFLLLFLSQWKNSRYITSACFGQAVTASQQQWGLISHSFIFYQVPRTVRRYRIFCNCCMIPWKDYRDVRPCIAKGLNKIISKLAVIISKFSPESFNFWPFCFCWASYPVLAWKFSSAGWKINSKQSAHIAVGEAVPDWGHYGPSSVGTGENRALLL